MIKSCFKYIITVFFIALFAFKGIVSVLPMLSAQLGKIAGLEKLINTETGTAEKNAEEKAETELKEFFLENNQYSFTGIWCTLATKSIAANNIARKQDVFLPVITPPPELA
ncbi:hypothetical protein [Ferruginibacter sp.]|nr:hypothetical protein [Ferruginibacter sp.]